MITRCKYSVKHQIQLEGKSQESSANLRELPNNGKKLVLTELKMVWIVLP